MVVQALTVTAEPLLFSQIIDGIVTHQALGGLLWYVVGLFLLHVARTMLELLEQWLQARIGYGVAVMLQKAILNRCMLLSSEASERSAPGELLSTIKEDVATVQGFCSDSLPTLLYDLGLLVMSIIALVHINLALLLPTLAATALIPSAYRVFTSRVRALRQEERAAEAANTQWMTEILASYPVALQYRALGYLSRRHAQLSEKWAGLGRRLRLFRVSGPCLAEVAGDIVRVLVVLGGGVLVAAQGGMTAGELTAYYLLVSRLTAPWVRVFRFGASLSTFLVSDERIESIIRLPAAPGEGERAGACGSRPRELIADQVRYTHGGSRTWRLHPSSFSVRQGETAGLVGPTGSGKSTLLRVMGGLLEPQGGAMLVDRNAAMPASLRALTALVPTNPFMFSGSIRDNILLGRPCSDERLGAILDCVHLDELLGGLPHGVNHQLPHGGGGLSTGQRQRIGIARALVGSPTFLFLDESTSGLDPHTEQSVIAGIRRLLPDVGLVACTHRLTAVSQLQSVSVMDAGQIVAQGSHEDLLKRSPVYAAMWESMLEGPAPTP